MAENVNTLIYDKALDRAAMLRLYERRINGKIELIIDGHVIRVDNLVKEAQLSGGGVTKLKTLLSNEILKTFQEAHNIAKKSLLDLVADQASYAYQNLEVAMNKIWRVKRPTRRIAEEIVLERPLHSNQTLAQGWTGISLGQKKRIEQLIRRGLSEKLPASEIARNIRRGSVHKITRMQSKALVTTAITSVHAQTDHEILKANAKALRGWQYVAVLDSRTSDICAHRDGTIYPIDDTAHLPPAHFNCRSTVIPVVKSWDDLSRLDNVDQVRKRNLEKLTPKQIQFYDGQTPLRESYHEWLSRQSVEVQLRHLGDYKKVELFNAGQLHISKFTNAEGNSLGIKELRAMTDSEYLTHSDTRRFAIAKEKLDAMRIGAATPDDFIDDKLLTKTLQDYYLLQAGELDGTLSLINYRGVLIGNKRNTKRRVLASPPREDQIVFNPITNRYEDARVYHPNFGVLAHNIKLIDDSVDLLPRDKIYIKEVLNGLSEKMGANERAAVADNLRILFSRYRKKPEVWANFKAVSQGQIKFDVMNVSDAIETQLRKDRNVLMRLKESNYIDPVLGPTQLQELHDTFISSIKARNNWEDRIAPKIARELRTVFDHKIPIIINNRLSNYEKQQFYLKFAKRLSLADMPDRDSFAVSLGRDLYNLANLNGTRRQWFETGMKLLDAKNVKKFFEIETFGVQKRRMKSRMSGRYFGPYYDTLSYNIRITDPRIQTYAKLNRKIDIGLRVGVLDDKNRLIFRENSKTYWIKTLTGYEDTRIPITSTSSFSDFPEALIDKDLVNALGWAGRSQYKIDKDFHDFVKKLIYFEDDKGRAKYFNDLNEYRAYMVSRNDLYERFKAMEWLRENDRAFSNNPFIDHRARIYDRGFIGPQSGESFRPFLNTAEVKKLGVDGYLNLQDQIGAFLGGIDDFFEGRYNSLSITGRQKIAEKWRNELITIGDHMRRGKPNDIRSILENPWLARIDGEEQGKVMRFALEMSKINEYLEGKYTKQALAKMSQYETALALEQDASSSGAQIIALTTRNKQLAELSNVIPTIQKKRLYDEIAAATYNDPRFRELNKKLGLTEKDLRKASKMQNMVTFYGAGERTGILNVERKLSKILDIDDAEVLVIKASERDVVLAEISARMARYEKFDPIIYKELKTLRENVKDIFNKGLDPGDDILEQLYFLDHATRDFVEKMSRAYIKIITPEDFKVIAKIMSEHLAENVPILKDFTKYFGRLAEDYLLNSKPSKSDFDWVSIGKILVLKKPSKHYVIPDRVSEFFGLKAGERVSEKVLKRFGFWRRGGTLYEIIHGVKPPMGRRTGDKYFKFEILGLGKGFEGIELFFANKLPKSWTNVPWVNFDGKVIEQNFTQRFEQRLAYKDKDNNWVNNILQIDQKTSATWWEELINKSGKINDIADASKARTAFAVNGNHSNDAVLVKKFHLWGMRSKIPTSTIHDAFFGNASDMLIARKALRKIYSEALDRNVILDTLDEMRARGLPEALYQKYLDEAKDIGLIPTPGRSRVGGKIIKDSDILRKEDILREVPENFDEDFYWYGVG